MVKHKYDSCGNISEVWENGKLSVRYFYDTLNRLVREDNKQFSKTWLYSYDNNGNILNKREFAFTLKATELLDESKSTDTVYAYDGDRLISWGMYSCWYDESTCLPMAFCNKRCTWEKNKLLKNYNGVMFSYDAQGRRMSKGNTFFTYDPEGNLLKQYDGMREMEFIYDHSGVIGVIYDGEKYIYRKNIQGDIIAILDSYVFIFPI